MFGLSRKWVIVVVAAAISKTMLGVLTPVGADFTNFVVTAQWAWSSLSQGTIPFLSVYTGIGIMLAPFYWLWTAMPIPHPPLVAIFGGLDTSLYNFNMSLEGFLLVFAMKLPIVLFDLFAGVLIFILIRDTTGSSDNARKAFLFWYLNPYNIFMIEVWGSVDVIPAVFVLLAILFALKKRWVASGLTLSFATVLRIYPLLLLPVFLFFCLRKTRRAAVALSVSYFAPLGVALYVLVGIFGSAQAAAGGLLNIAFSSPWLLRLYGIPLAPGVQNTLDKAGLLLPLFLYPIQLYIASRFWKTRSYSLLSLATAFLLIHFAATTYEPYHFNWITPLLAVCYGVDRRRLRLLSILFVAAYISMYTYSDVSSLGHAFFFLPTFSEAMRSAALMQTRLFSLVHEYVPLSMGIFHGLLGVLLIKLNLDEMQLPSRLQGRLAASSAGRIDQVALRRFQETHRSNSMVSRDWHDGVAIVVPCYNHSAFLEATFTSLARQTYRPFDVIFVEDHSTDDTLDRLRQLCGQLPAGIKSTILQTPRNSGQAFAINLGVASSKASILMILNDDDYLMHDALQATLEILRHSRDLFLFGATSLPLSGSRNPRPDDPHLLIHNACSDYSTIPLTRYAPTDIPNFSDPNDLNLTHSGSAFFRTAWEVVGGYYSDRSRRVVPPADRDFQLRLASLFPTAVSMTIPFSYWRTDSSVDKGLFT